MYLQDSTWTLKVQNGNIKLEGYSTRVIKIKVTRPCLDRVYMSSLVLEFLFSLVYDHLHGSNFYKIVFLKSFKFYKMVSKFEIIFERLKLKDWSCFESKYVLELIKHGFKELEIDWIWWSIEFDKLFVKCPALPRWTNLTLFNSVDR